jgi:hypothetical protein
MECLSADPVKSYQKINYQFLKNVILPLIRRSAVPLLSQQAAVKLKIFPVRPRGVHLAAFYIAP